MIYIYICVCVLIIYMYMCVYRFYLPKGGRERERESSRARNQPAPMREWSQDRKSCNDWWPNCQRCWQMLTAFPQWSLWFAQGHGGTGNPTNLRCLKSLGMGCTTVCRVLRDCHVTWHGEKIEIICHHVSWYVIWHPGCFRHFRRRMDGADERLGRTHARHNSECCESATWCNSGVHALDCWLSYWTEVACRET